MHNSGNDVARSRNYIRVIASAAKQSSFPRMLWHWIASLRSQ